MPKKENALEPLGDNQRHVRYFEQPQVDDFASQSTTLSARAAWLETIRIVARAAARADHEAAIRHDGRSRCTIQK